MKKRTLTCIVCPNGCELTACPDINGTWLVDGAECKKGLIWAKQEITDPKRTVASSVLVINGDLPLVSVKTDAPVPVEQIPEIMKKIKSVKVKAPIKINQVIINNVAETETSIIATKNIKKK